MKKLLPLAFTLFMACQPSTPPPVQQPVAEPNVITPVVQKEPEDTYIPVPSSIEEIRAAYTRTITQYAHHEFDSVSQNYNCGDSHGTVTYFSEYGKLRMIIHHSFLDDLEDDNEQFFIQDDHLYFVYNANYYWHAKSDDEPKVKTEIRESRTYIVNDEKIKCLYKTIRLDTTVVAKNEDIDCGGYQPLSILYETLLRFKGSDETGCLPYSCGE